MTQKIQQVNSFMIRVVYNCTTRIKTIFTRLEWTQYTGIGQTDAQTK